MARRNAFKIELDQVVVLGEQLDAAEQLDQSAAMAARLNEIVDDVYETARGRMNAGINLTDAYLQSKMYVVHASPGRGLSAEIVARGGSGDQTPLGRYMTRQVTAAAPRAKGDPKRGISAGRKAAGVAVEVSRGSEKVLQNAFTMPLRAGNTSGGNGIGIFTRSRFGIVRHRYGPAVYQLFRVAAGELEQSVADTVEEQLGRVAVQALEEALK